MGDVLVKRAVLADGRINTLTVGLHNLPDRTIDRETAISWMKDGHSLIPMVDSKRQAALQLVEADDGTFVRIDNAKVAADSLPELG
jgi:hypothetical protein